MKLFLSDVYRNRLILNIFIAFYFQLRNVFRGSFLASSTALSSSLSVWHHDPWQRWTTTELPRPYCRTFRLLLGFFGQHKQSRDNTLLPASWSTHASNSLVQRKVEFLRQGSVSFFIRNHVSPCCSFYNHVQGAALCHLGLPRAWIPPPTEAEDGTGWGLSNNLFPMQSHSGAGKHPAQAFFHRLPK